MSRTENTFSSSYPYFSLKHSPANISVQLLQKGFPIRTTCQQKKKNFQRKIKYVQIDILIELGYQNYKTCDVMNERM